MHKSGSSTGAFYSFFRNKDDIFASALELIGNRIAAVLNKAIANESGGTRIQMKIAVETFIAYLIDNPYLGDHPNPAIDDQVKSGQREMA